MQKGSLGIDDLPQKSSVDITQAKTKKGFRRKKGESPFKIQTDIKIKSEKNNPIIPTLMLGEG